MSATTARLWIFSERSITSSLDNFVSVLRICYNIDTIKQTTGTQEVQIRGKVITGTGIVRQALKAVVGEERYKDFTIYTDKLKDRSKLKIQRMGQAHLEKNEVQEVVDYIKENYGKEVEVKTGVSPSWHRGYVTFYI